MNCNRLDMKCLDCGEEQCSVCHMGLSPQCSKCGSINIVANPNYKIDGYILSLRSSDSFESKLIRLIKSIVDDIEGCNDLELLLIIRLNHMIKYIEQREPCNYNIAKNIDLAWKEYEKRD